MPRNSNEYLKFKPERTEERNDLLKVQLAVKNKVNLNEIPGFLEPKRVRPKNTKSDMIANTHGLMSGWNILKELEELKKVKDGAAKLQEVKGHLQLDLRKKFQECNVAFKCDGQECTMADLKQCPVCFSVTEMGCSNKACLKKDGSKQVMIRVNQRSTSKVNPGK